MSITTKTGDKGMTSLLFAGRVRKDDLRVEAYGTLDEVSAFLGLTKSLIRDKATKNIINRIQTELFVMGAEIATRKPLIHNLERRINESHVRYLESLISGFEKKYESKECCFILAGENIISASLDIARTVARRAERIIATLYKKKYLANKHILVYINRLSDLLFLIARYYEKKTRKVRYETR